MQTDPFDDESEPQPEPPAALMVAPGHAAPANTLQWGRDQVELLKRTVCKGSTDDEFSLFLHVATRAGLDPFARQIHAVKRWDSVERREVMAIQTGIDGFRLIAQRTGEYEGQTPPAWCGEDGVWREVWIGQTPPSAAKIGVYRKGFREAIVAVAHWKGYAQKTKEGNPNRMWANLGPEMLAKCAEALALRKAFPVELSGLHAEEEMLQADGDGSSTKRKLKMQDGTDAPVIPRFTSKRGAALDAGPVVPWGKNEGEPVASLTPKQLAGYLRMLKDDLASAEYQDGGDSFAFRADKERDYAMFRAEWCRRATASQLSDALDRACEADDKTGKAVIEAELKRRAEGTDETPF